MMRKVLALVLGVVIPAENNDPNGRMLALANHNNDLAEYWEWSDTGLFGVDPTNEAYKIGVNYVIYSLTH